MMCLLFSFDQNWRFSPDSEWLNSPDSNSSKYIIINVESIDNLWQRILNI